MAEFYDNADGKVHFRAPAGGGGSIYDAPATDAEITANPAAYRKYVVAKQAASEASARETAQAQAVKAATEALAEMQTQNAALAARVAELETLLAANTPAPGA